MKIFNLTIIICLLFVAMGSCLVLAEDENDKLYGVQIAETKGKIINLTQIIEDIVPWNTYRFSVMVRTRDMIPLKWNRNFSLRVNFRTDTAWVVREDYDMEEITIGHSEGLTVNLDNNNIFLYNLQKGNTYPEWEELWYEFKIAHPETTRLNIQLYVRSDESIENCSVIFFQPQLVDVNNPDVNLLENPGFDEFNFIGDVLGWDADFNQHELSIVEVDFAE